MRYHGGIPGASRELDGGDRLGERADLIHLDEHGVGDLLADAPLDTLDVRDEKIVPDELHPVAQFGREAFPSWPVVLCEAVLDRDEWIAVRPYPVEPDHAGGAEGSLLPRQRVRPVGEELVRCRVYRELEIRASVVSSPLSRGYSDVVGLCCA